MAAITVAMRTEISQLYVSLFGRAPDSEGLGFWVSSLAGGNTIAKIAQSMYDTSPARAYYPLYATPSEVVTTFYTNVLGRAPDAEGLAFWVNEFNNAVTPGTFFAKLISNVVNYSGTDAAGLVSKSLFNNKVAVGQFFGESGGTIAGATAALAGVTSVAASVDTAKTAISNPVVAAQTFTLTTNADTGAAFTGGSGNDTFNALGTAFWSIGDAIDGGTGSDTFNVTQTGAITLPLSATVTNVETINLVSGSTNVLTTTTGFSGLTALNATGVTGATITSAATTAIAVTDTTSTAAIAVNGGSTVSVTSSGQTGGTGTIAVGATTAAAGAVTVKSTTTNTGTAGTIGVTGGTVVSVTQAAGGTATAGSTSTAGAVTVTGNASTTTVTVADSIAAAGFTATATLAGVRGHTNGAVTITDVNNGSATAAGVLTTVTLDSFAAATVNSNALNSLTLKGTGTSAAVTMGSLTTPTVTALALNVSGLTTTGAVTTPTVTTLNIASTTAASTIADLTAAAATTINVSGDAKLTITANTNLAATTISSSAQTAGGLVLSTALGTGITFTGGAGADTIGIGSTTKTITMGAGNDRVITSTGVVGTGGTVAAGDGTDTIVFSTTANAVTAGGSSTFNSKFTGFETVELTNALSGTMNVGGINNATTVVLVAGGDSTTTAIVQDIASGGTVETRAAGTGFVVNVLSAVGGTSDVLNLKLARTAQTTFTSMTAANVETININVADAAAGTAAAPASAAVVHSATLVATAAKTVTVTGNNGLNLTNTNNVAITTFDASGVVANDTAASVTAVGAAVAATADTAPNLAVTFTSVNTTANAAVTIKGGAGDDVLTVSAGAVNVDTITGGEGADTITGGTGNDVIILTETTAAIDTVVFAATAAAANGIDTITGFAAGSTGIDVARLVAAVTTNTVQAVAGVADFEVSTNTTLTTGAAAFALTGANSTTGDIVEITATLSAFGNLGTAGVVDGSELLKALSSINVAASSLTATTADDDFYVVAYQSGNAYLYEVTNTGTDVIASEIALIAVFNGVAANAFASGDFTIA